MMTNIRGEMTIDANQQFRLKEGQFVRTVAATLKVGSEKVGEDFLKFFAKLIFEFAAAIAMRSVYVRGIHEMRHC